MIIPFRNTTSQGIVRDLLPHQIPIDAYSNGDNVRFVDGAIKAFKGYSQVYDDSPADEDVIHWMMPYPHDTDYEWIVCGLVDAWTIKAGTYTQRTRTEGDADYSGAASNIWTGTVLGGVAVITNDAVDVPQKIDLETPDAKFLNLKWDATHDWDDIDGSTTPFQCHAIRSYKNHLIALDMVEDGVRYPYRVRWSHGADSGDEPSTWDAADATKDAGFVDLDETSDYVIDCATLRNENIIYKENTTWIQNFIGAPQIMSHQKLFASVGMMAKNCVQEYNGLHVVKTLDDWIAHDGRSIAHRIIDKKWRTWLSNNLDTTNYGKSFVAPNYELNEFWFCFPETGSTYPSKALVWNFKEDTLSVKSLPNTTYIAHGIVDPEVTDTWAAASGAIQDQEGIWDIRYYNPTKQSLMRAQYNASTDIELYQMDSTNQDAGVNQTCYVERTGLAVAGKDKQGQPKVDAGSIKRMKRVIPYIDGTIGGVVKVFVGYQMDLQDDVTWKEPQDFIIGTSRWVDVRCTGRYLAVKFLSSTNIEWTMTGYDLDLDVVGGR